MLAKTFSKCLRRALKWVKSVIQESTVNKKKKQKKQKKRDHVAEELVDEFYEHQEMQDCSLLSFHQ